MGIEREVGSLWLSNNRYNTILRSLVRISNDLETQQKNPSAINTAYQEAKSQILSEYLETETILRRHCMNRLMDPSEIPEIDHVQNFSPFPDDGKKTRHQVY